MRTYLALQMGATSLGQHTERVKVQFISYKWCRPQLCLLVHKPAVHHRYIYPTHPKTLVIAVLNQLAFILSDQVSDNFHFITDRPPK